MAEEDKKNKRWYLTYLDMVKHGLHYGKVWPMGYFEKWLRIDRNHVKFGFAVSYIRQELEHHGYYISGRGQNKTQLVIIQPDLNLHVAAGTLKMVRKRVKRTVTLCEKTVTSGFTKEQKTYMSSLLRLARKWLALMDDSEFAELIK